MLISGHLEAVAQVIDFLVGQVPQVGEYYVERYHKHPVIKLLEK